MSPGHRHLGNRGKVATTGDNYDRLMSVSRKQASIGSFRLQRVRPLSPKSFSAVSGSQEYKVSSFEQRLISEIEFRLERSQVEESDDDVQHDEDSAGQGMAPSFNQKLKHYKVFEGMPVTFSCKVHGEPKPKVGVLVLT